MILAFEQFSVDGELFELRADGALVSVEPQVLTLLVYLMTHRQRVVTKDELFDALWGHRFVSEAALTTQIKSLRQLLGDSGTEQRVIKTVRGRGYQFIAEVGRHRPSQPAAPAATTPAGNLGVPRSPLFGRDMELQRCRQALQRHRMVTLLGIGGTGKTALARTSGRHLQDEYAAGVWFIDLVPVTDATGIDYAIANTLGLRLNSGNTREQLQSHLCHRDMLLIFDNCEHIEDDVAQIMDHLLEFTQAPSFLLTSRDPLDLADEYQFYLKPLAVDDSAGASPAVALFLSTAKLHGAVQQNRARSTIAHICEQLDGLPLAIELAAAQLRHLSLEELSARLDRRFEVLSGRRRIGNRRQTNLQTVLADTWALLTRVEKDLLSQLAVFPSVFTIQDAEMLLDGMVPAGGSQALARFVELSLISRTNTEGSQWRLLESVRMFALFQSDEKTQLNNAGRHAAWCLQQVGDNPLRHRHDFTLARWAISHYDDIVAAQDYLFNTGNSDALATLCSALALPMQLDEGVRAREQYDRLQRYLQATQEPRSLSRLHAVAAVCGMILLRPDLLAEHAQAGVSAAEAWGNDNEIASQLILLAARTSFTDPAEASRQLDRAVNLASSQGRLELVDAANTFRAWQLAMAGEYATACTYARAITEQHWHEPLNNLTCNAASVLIASSASIEPATALTWAERLDKRPEAHLVWSAELLLACVFAQHQRIDNSLELMRKVQKRLTQAGSAGLPDLLVPAIYVMLARDLQPQAAALLSTIKALQQPLLSFHLIAMYRQLRENHPDLEAEPLPRTIALEQVARLLANA
ncbi:MAG: winged helix-turn-helix domain-containing protein [Pseudomonadota bacterium]